MINAEERLSKRVRAAMGDHNNDDLPVTQCVINMRKEVVSLQAECEKLRKDAERYRWLRDPCSGAERVVTYGRGDYGRGLMSYTMLDEAIDAAIAKATGAQP